MIAQPDLDEPRAPKNRRHWLRWAFGAALITPLILFAIAYSQRTTIAGNLARDQLKKYGVRASYQIKKVGFRTQRLENIRLGDPDDPDFSAKVIEIDLALNFDGVTLRDVRAQGVRLKGRYQDGKFHFGELDKFADPDDKQPLEIPDIGVMLSDARIRLDTPWGRIGAALSGEGLLRQRFEGKLALRAPMLRQQDCAARAVAFDGRLLLDFRQPNLIGPWAADMLICEKAGYAIAKLTMDGELRLSETFGNWFGDVEFAARSARIGTAAVSAPGGMLSFDGKKDRTNFGGRFFAGGYDAAGVRLGKFTASAKGYGNFGPAGLRISSRGDADIRNISLARDYAAGIDMAANAAGTTPIAPLLQKIAPALRRAMADFDGRLRYDASIGDGAATLLLDGAELRARSGLRIAQAGRGQIGQRAGRWALASPLRMTAAGGDLPTVRLALEEGAEGFGSWWRGDVAVERYAAAGASLAVPGFAFAGRMGGAWNFTGSAVISGPFPGGSVSGLKLPIDGRYDRGGFSIGAKCQNVAFDAVTYQSLSLTRRAVRLCPGGGGPMLRAGRSVIFAANVPSLALSGSYAGSPVTALGRNLRFDSNQGLIASNIVAAWGITPVNITAPTIQYNFKTGLLSENIRIETGEAQARTFFDIARLDGVAAPGGFRGKVSGAGGQIGNVPVVISDAAGEWSLTGGNLAVSAGMQIADAADAVRFNRLNIPDVLLTFENGVVNMLGHLHEPTTGRKIAGVDIRHIFANGTGRALIAVDDLNFDRELQPELLTELTFGVIQNAAGAVYGDGMISWNTEQGSISSSGTFGTNGLDLAAGFGPVRGLKTELKFTDLLKLETAPMQIARIDTINPGIAALDGIVRYRLLADQKVAIEGGSWPFAGGELSIKPTVWDLGVDAKRELTLEVKGVEIAKFIETLDLNNISATGIVDGQLPMVFDASGGQIVGGELVARPGGGNVSYIGDLTYKDLSAYANFAFDALRSIDYSGLRIGMRGSLAGEIITDVTFEGIKQGKGAKQSFITRQLARVPIKFNIRTEAPFFELFGSVRSFYDPAALVEKNRPEILRRQRGGQPPAAPAEPSPPAEKPPGG